MLHRSLHVFLCHSSGDKPRVRSLYSRLNTEGISPWLDEKELLPGQDWQLEITRAVQNSDAVLVCLSKDAINKRGYIHKEIRYALDVADEQPEGTIFIIPIRLEACDVPERLRRWQWVDLFEEDGYKRLVDALRTRARTLGIAIPIRAIHKRRLPIYLLLDCSRSMEGEPRNAIELGIKFFISFLKNDPQMREMVWIGLIAFAGDAWPILPLTEVLSFSPKGLFTHVQEETALGAALVVLNETIDREVVRRTINNPGDYCPLAFAFIDGMPTDDWAASAKLLLGRQDRKLATLAFIGAGSQVSVAQLTAEVPGIIGINLNELTPDFSKSLFKWIDQDDV